MSWVLLSSAGAFGLIFLTAAVAKLSSQRSTINTLEQFGVPRRAAPAAAVALPLAELLVASSVLIDRVRRIGAIAGIALLAAFTVALLRQIRDGSNVSCNCFGSLSAEPISVRLVWRNAAFIALGIVTAAVADEGRVSGWAADLSPDERVLLAIAALAAVTSFGLALVVHRLLVDQRQLRASVRLVEELFDRQDGRTVPPPAQLPTPSAGLPIGVHAPAFQLLDLDGALVSGPLVAPADGPVLLTFVGAGCRACDELLPRLDEWARSQSDVPVVVIAGGGRDAAHQLGNRPGFAVLLDVPRAVAALYTAEWTPAAVVVGGNGRIASRIAYGADAAMDLAAAAAASIESLRHGHVLTAGEPSTIGRQVPTEVDLPVEHDDNAVLMFWSDSCSFCEQFAPELKALEDRPGGELPGLVFVSRQPMEVGFRSPTVVDTDGSITRSFGVHGTPSAVLVGPGRRVLSDVSAGAPVIRRLLGVDAPA